MRKKIEAGLDGLDKERKAGEDKVNHKYKNRRQELDLQQHQERLLNENDNMLKKSITAYLIKGTTTGKFPSKPQHLMMKSTTDGFSTNTINKKNSVKNYSTKNA